MKEYFRIMFTDFSVLNESDWAKWRKYSGITLNIMISVAIVVWIIAVII